MAALPAQMTAIGIKASGGPDMLVPEKRPVPTPGEGATFRVVLPGSEADVPSATSDHALR